MNIKSIASDASFCETEEACEDFLMNLRWSKGFHCPRCDHHEAFQIRTRRLLECKECRMQISITAGTIMHKSKLSLLTWFKAIQLMFKSGVEFTAYGLSEILNINYRSAKLLVDKICLAIKVEESRLLALRKMKMKAIHSNSTKSKFPKPKIIGNWCDSFDLKSYIEVKLSKLTQQSVMKTFVSIHLYSRFLKCFQV
ncbi:transposase [Paenibacillus qinlingensis]|uniref:transposase n=1 Tax=Paenibacillus qinlingensis TaxID=1837343 RepID=UPI001565BFE4|nr:transposase [Paenibacillus qinlingensis]NQX58865.1 transposase [Paenibacillus qinlingensis]